MTLDVDDFSLVFSRALGKVIVHIQGPLDADTAPQLKARLVDVIDGQGNRHVVLDLREVSFIDAAGFSVLVNALKRMQKSGGELILSGPTSSVARSFDAAGLDTVFDITPAWAHPARGDGRTNQGSSRGSELGG
jgi:anti-anti-sigma factor